MVEKDFEFVVYMDFQFVVGMDFQFLVIHDAIPGADFGIPIVVMYAPRKATNHQ